MNIPFTPFVVFLTAWRFPETQHTPQRRFVRFQALHWTERDYPTRWHKHWRLWTYWPKPHRPAVCFDFTISKRIGRK